MVNLKSAYLQQRVSEDLWKFQVVRYIEKNYCLTRLVFGLSSAPRIMVEILKTVLTSSPEVGKGTSSYIYDILVDTSVVTSQQVVAKSSK